ncbi:transferase [Forsythia ovata]
MDFGEDIFEPLLNIEATTYEEAYKEGYADGFVSGKEEGRLVGLKIGFEMGQELGFYSGCIDIWTSTTRVDPNYFSSRVQKTIKRMDDLLKKYPISDPENESVSEIIESLRLKFRAICASLNVKLDYNGYPMASGTEKIEF